MAISYRDLLENIQKMNPEQLDQTVTVFVSGVGEFYSLVEDFPLVEAQAETNDQLDPGHPYLVI